ncbi:4-hydroxybenzoate polyprenyl transferase [Cardiosporidium cionae]|uniref:4-hydroxybenzoate polyprenyltransferase, mitochondrial n=1 Tax=Cardiosporidium cionae TaxID=476202 RepID=A0ABQ7JDD4_9APIC|nr:4-hydroxybenzoate polyprenyl transferase [Cardiosporidium cionae]|eukprot:KAF8821879.1 4-hydroxybenzoate polyprenyl transferase [Cardiosporidium cionae]
MLRPNRVNVLALPVARYSTGSTYLLEKLLHLESQPKIFAKERSFGQSQYLVIPRQQPSVDKNRNSCKPSNLGSNLCHSGTSWDKKRLYCSRATGASQTNFQGDKIALNDGTKSSSVPKNVYLLRLLPEALHPYAYLSRLHAPIGTWLLFWPCAWSVALAMNPANALLSAYSIALCAIGAILMRSSGCIINDLWDRDLDKLVERTRTRPLASKLLSPSQAIAYLSLNLLLALGVLLQFNPLTVLVGLSSMGLVLTYPLMKRITYWPQFVLGLAFNWGALLGWTAATGTFCAPIATPLCLYFAGVCWTMVYDTIYAQQDKQDDILVGIKSTAILWDKSCTAWLTGFSCSMLGLLVLAGISNGMLWPYYAATCLTGAHLTWQVYSAISPDRENYARLFRSNKWIGFILFSGIVGSKMVEFYDVDKNQVKSLVKLDTNSISCIENELE